MLPGETDVVGLPRVLAHSCGAVPKPDIGAFESPAPSCPAPTVSLTSPANGASFTQGQAVTAGYTCAVASPAAISSCTGPAANGSKIDTSTPGSHTFTVTAVANDGASAIASATYTVKLPKPSLGKLHASHKTFREGSKLATIAKKKHKKPPVGTTLKFTLNTTATLKLVFSHKVKRPHHKTKTKTDGTIKLTGHPGTDKITFQGRLSKHHKLKPGTYTITITATNSTGKSKTRTIKITISQGLRAMFGRKRKKEEESTGLAGLSDVSITPSSSITPSVTVTPSTSPTPAPPPPAATAGATPSAPTAGAAPGAAGAATPGAITPQVYATMNRAGRRCSRRSSAATGRWVS